MAAKQKFKDKELAKTSEILVYVFDPVPIRSEPKALHRFQLADKDFDTIRDHRPRIFEILSKNSKDENRKLLESIGFSSAYLVIKKKNTEPFDYRVGGSFY